MSAFDAETEHLVLQAVRAVRTAGDAFSWHGRREPLLPAFLRDLPAARRRNELRRRLTDRLYASFFCTGGVVPAEAPVAPDPHEVAGWCDGLARASRRRACRDSGWTLAGGDRRVLLLKKDGVTFRADARASRRAGGSWSTLVPSERRRLSPGFYIVLGETPLAPDESLFRVYWNLWSEGARPLIRAATRRLDDAAIPFRLKVGAHPAFFTRVDAGVLYVPRRNRRRALGIVADVRRLISRHLKPSTPPFTKRLAPGVALAEDPGGESFGMTRCGALSEAILGSRNGRSGDGASLRAVAAAFARAEIRCDRPYLEPGSRDDYPPLR